MMPLIAPSILAADLSRLADEIAAVEKAGADWIHVDVMDGHFVANLTMGPDVVAAMNQATGLPLDVHLMIDNPQNFIEPFASAGADLLTVHREAVDDLETLFAQIERYGLKPAVAINPDTPIEAVSPFISRAAMILVMSVHPGFAGQGFLSAALPKLEALRELKQRSRSACLLEVDGGIKRHNARNVIAAGADVVVAGSGIFGEEDYSAVIAAMRGEQE